MAKETGIIDYLKAGYSHFYMQTEEPERGIEILKKELEAYKESGDENFFKPVVWGLSPENQDPMQPLIELDSAPAGTVLILKNFHWFIKDIQTGQPNYEITQFIQDRLSLYRSRAKKKVIVVVSPVTGGLPTDLSREFIPLKFPLPDGEEINGLLQEAIVVLEKNPKFKKPSRKEQEKLVDMSKGMTKDEVENALFYSVVKTGGKLDPVLVKKQRTAFLENVSGVKYVEYGETFDNLIGYQRVKNIVKTFSRPDNPMAKGMILLGPPGVGKSHFAKAVAGEFGMMMLTIEAAEMTGSLVGQNEEKVSRFIRAACAMSPCVLFFDEIEKALAGVKGGAVGGVAYSSDSINRRAWAPFLKFMQDRTDPDTGKPVHVYVIATCNDITSLPPEYIRAERWDCAPIFIDLPYKDERESIMDFYEKFYEVEGTVSVEDTEGWSGAELRAMCRLAKQGGTTIDKAKELILPVSSTMELEIEGLRRWAMAGDSWIPGRGRAIPASEIKLDRSKGVFTKAAGDRLLDI